MGPAIGIDFGTTNSVVAIAGANGQVETFAWPSLEGPVSIFRTALTFWSEGRAPRSVLRHVAGPQAIERAVAGHDNQRFVQSIKTHLASPLFTSTRLYGATLTIEALVATFLDHLVGPHRDVLGVAPRVVAGRPVVFAGERPDEGLALERLTRAYALAGLPEVDVAYEPLGASYWYARDLTRAQTVLVADFGGGTSDFSLIRFTPAAGLPHAQPLGHSGVGVAGDTFDARIVDHLVAPQLGKGTRYRSLHKLLPLPAYPFAALAQWHQLSWLKTSQTLAELRRLGAASEAPERLADLVTLIEFDLGFELNRAVSALKARLSTSETADFTFDREGVRLSGTVDRADFEGWIAADLVAIAAAVDRVMTGSSVADHEVDAVFMTGGTSYVPAVRRLFTDRFGPDRIHSGNAFQSVASGLALMAADRGRAAVASSSMAH